MSSQGGTAMTGSTAWAEMTARAEAGGTTSLLTINNNTLVFAVSPWDIAWVGRRLTVREGQRKFLLEIQFNPPNEVRIERGNLRRNGVEFRISPTETVINGKPQVSGNDFVGSWGITVGHRIGGGLAIGRVNCYR
jgi:hypothetical protein